MTSSPLTWTYTLTYSQCVMSQPSTTQPDLCISVLPEVTIDNDPVLVKPTALFSFRLRDRHAAVAGYDSPTPMDVAVTVMLTLSQAADLHNALCAWIHVKTTKDTRPVPCSPLHIEDPI